MVCCLSRSEQCGGNCYRLKTETYVRARKSMVTIRECSAGRYMQHITAFIATRRALFEIPAEIPAPSWSLFCDVKMLKIYLRIYISTVHTYNPHGQERLVQVKQASKPLVYAIPSLCSLFCAVSVLFVPNFRIQLLWSMERTLMKPWNVLRSQSIDQRQDT